MICVVVASAAFADVRRMTWREDKATKTALKRLGANLLRLRTAKKWSQDDAAERCNISLQQTYQQIESAKVNVTMFTLTKLASGFGVDLRDLLAPPPR
jgi:DNA-binding XRE family transcriptional regulator